MKEINFVSAISVFELLVYVAVGSIGLLYLNILFQVETFVSINSFAFGITFFAMSYCLGFMLNYVGIKIYKYFSHKNYITTLLNKCKTCISGNFDECQEIAKNKCGYEGNDDEKYSKLLYYEMRYSIANKYSWNNFAEYANIYHYFALSLLALILLFIPITTYRVISTGICKNSCCYFVYIIVSLGLCVFFLQMAEYFQKVHIRRVVTSYLNMIKDKD